MIEQSLSYISDDYKRVANLFCRPLVFFGLYKPAETFVFYHFFKTILAYHLTPCINFFMAGLNMIDKTQPTNATAASIQKK